MTPEAFTTKKATELTVGDEVYRHSHRQGMLTFTVVKITKNTLQFRQWSGSTFFVTKFNNDRERKFIVKEKDAR